MKFYDNGVEFTPPDHDADRIKRFKRGEISLRTPDDMNAWLAFDRVNTARQRAARALARHRDSHIISEIESYTRSHEYLPSTTARITSI